jgi:hypothetical protein
MKIKKTAALVALLAGISWGAHQAHAAAANALSANQAVTGTATGSGSASYSYTVSNNKDFVAILSETGVHDASFLPRLTITGSDNSVLDGGRAYYKDFRISHPANGSWTVTAGRADTQNTSGGNYSLTLVQPPFSGATALSASPQAGSSDTAKVDGWTFTGTAGHNVQLAITTTGDKKFAPTLYVFSPSGVLVRVGSCGGCESGVNVTENGTWSVAASKATDDGSTGSYTLSVTDAN